MHYIRTFKNNYDIDIVVDFTDNIDYVQSSGLDWIEIGEQNAENGNYFYNGKVISVDSDDYSIIENLINEKEDPLRIEREAIQAELDALAEAEILAALENLVMEEPTDFIPPEPPDPNDEGAVAAAEQSGKVDPRKFTKPMATPILGVESTESNLRDWERNYLNISSLISALSDEKYSEITNNVVIFDPAHEFPDGFTQTHFPFPDDTVIDYIDHLKAVKQTYKDLLDTICTDLNLPPIPEA
jgi:hypothetical protein